MNVNTNSVREPVLKLKDIRKTFGGVTAIENFSLDVRPGEIVALVGDNGAGKSTLIKIISGVYTPTSGTITIENQTVAMSNATMARAHGIEVVYQDLALADQQTVYMNMFLGREPVNRFGLLDRRRMISETETLVKELDVRIPSAHATIRDLSGGQRQGVAVARAAAFGSKVVIMDEPTAALGVKESRRVLELILDVRSRGLPIVLISHNMPHVFEVADRIHVHRLGKRLCVINPKEHTMSDAVAFMTGAKEPPREALAA